MGDNIINNALAATCQAGVGGRECRRTVRPLRISVFPDLTSGLSPVARISFRSHQLGSGDQAYLMAAISRCRLRISAVFLREMVPIIAHYHCTLMTALPLIRDAHTRGNTRLLRIYRNCLTEDHSDVHHLCTVQFCHLPRR